MHCVDTLSRAQPLLTMHCGMCSYHASCASMAPHRPPVTSFTCCKPCHQLSDTLVTCSHVVYLSLLLSHYLYDQAASLSSCSNDEQCAFSYLFKCIFLHPLTSPNNEFAAVVRAKIGSHRLVGWVARMQGLCRVDQSQCRAEACHLVCTASGVRGLRISTGLELQRPET